MKITKENISSGIKLSIIINEKEIARAYLYILSNKLHQKPFGLMEDVFVDSSFRGQGLGTKIIKELIKTAKEKNCYKLICTSRYGKEKVHKLYNKIGFSDHGKEFRINLSKSS